MNDIFGRIAITAAISAYAGFLGLLFRKLETKHPVQAANVRFRWLSVFYSLMLAMGLVCLWWLLTDDRKRVNSKAMIALWCVVCPYFAWQWFAAYRKWRALRTAPAPSPAGDDR